MAPTPQANGVSHTSNAKLSLMLRECAVVVARNEMDPVLYQALRDLNEYVARQTGATAPTKVPAATPIVISTTTTTIPAPSSNHNNSKESPSDQFSKRVPFLAKKFGKHSQQSSPPPPQQQQQPPQRQPQPPQPQPQPPQPPQQQPHHQQQQHHETEWCQEHFTMGCACKIRRLSNNSSATTETTKSATTTTTTTTLTQNRSSPRIMSRPPFQRPVNPNSPLIANGWIEQQRRSKMRVVWKDILASLVEGRKPGEETTLWIQREVTNPTTNKKELEALHQIPMKWLEDVQYLDYSTDQRFSVRVYNVAEEFLFRCHDEEAAQSWVMTLRSAKEIAQRGIAVPPGATAAAVDAATSSNNHGRTPVNTSNTSKRTNLDWDRASGNSSQKSSSVSPKSWPEDEAHEPQPSEQAPATNYSTQRMTVKELRAIAHGVGINTVGMERGELEAAVARINLGASAPTPPPAAATAAAPVDAAKVEELRRRQQLQQQLDERKKKEEEEELLRRRQLEEAAARRQREVEEAAARRVREAEEAAARREAEERQREAEEAARRQREAEEEIRRQLEEEEREIHRQRLEQQMAEQQRKKLAEEERRRAAAAAAAEEERLRMEEEEERRRLAEEEEAKQRRMAAAAAAAAEEEQRRRLAAEEEQRRRLAAEEELRRRQAAEEEQRRRLAEEEFRRRAAAEEEQRRRLAEQQAELRRRQEEIQRQQQQQQQWHQQQQQHWQQQQWQQHQQVPLQHPPWQQPHPQQMPWPHAQPPPPQAQWQQHAAYQQQQQQQQQQARPVPPPPPAQAQHAQPQPPPHQAPASPVNAKYAKMAQQTDGDSQADIARVKHEILLRWALQPPTMQTLRPIDVLVTTIHSVFPPAFGIAGHEHFTKWKAVTPADIGATVGSTADTEKLSKVMKKIRVLLHPDKLPRDLNSEQQFMCKMLWDITSDAWEEYQKRNEELDWIRT